VCLWIDCGFTVICEKLPRTRRWQALIRTTILLSTACFAGTIVWRDLIPRYDDTGSFPEGPQVAEFLSQHMQPGDALHTKIPANAPLEFYLQQRGLPIDVAPSMERAARAFFVVDSRHFELADLTDEPVLKLFEIDTAQVFSPSQND
jgi:hypothetical protein